jgi:phosphoribosylanthranilate isomerase
VQSSSRTRIKICGITRPDDAVVAALAGADAIGLVFYPKSPRAVSIAQAQHIVAALPPFVTRVGLFVNEEAARVAEVLASVPLDVLQFHGDESPAYCRSFTRPWLKALRMKPGLDVAANIAAYRGAHGILLDAWDAQQYGGTGTTFDWTRVSLAATGTRVILAGGLHAGNVAGAIAQVRPWAVDVSSGVESTPGIKAGELIRQFISEVQRV